MRRIRTQTQRAGQDRINDGRRAMSRDLTADAGPVVTARPKSEQATPDSQAALAFRFDRHDIDVLRDTVDAGFELWLAPGMDQQAVDDAVGPGVVGLIAQHRPSDPRKAPDLRWQQVLSAGVEHLLGSGQWPRAVTLTNARGVYAPAIGQYVMGAILRVTEQVDARRELQRDRRWPEDENRFTGRPDRKSTRLNS